MVSPARPSDPLPSTLSICLNIFAPFAEVATLGLPLLLLASYIAAAALTLCIVSVETHSGRAPTRYGRRPIAAQAEQRLSFVQSPGR